MFFLSVFFRDTDALVLRNVSKEESRGLRVLEFPEQRVEESFELEKALNYLG